MSGKVSPFPELCCWPLLKNRKPHTLSPLQDMTEVSVMESWCLLVFSVISLPHRLSWNPWPRKWLTFRGKKWGEGGQEAEGRKPNILAKEKLSQKTPESEVQGVMSTALSFTQTGPSTLGSSSQSKVTIIQSQTPLRSDASLEGHRNFMETDLSASQ